VSLREMGDRRWEGPGVPRAGSRASRLLQPQVRQGDGAAGSRTPLEGSGHSAPGAGQHGRLGSHLGATGSPQPRSSLLGLWRNFLCVAAVGGHAAAAQLSPDPARRGEMRPTPHCPLGRFASRHPRLSGQTGSLCRGGVLKHSALQCCLPLLRGGCAAQARALPLGDHSMAVFLAPHSAMLISAEPYCARGLLVVTGWVDGRVEGRATGLQASSTLVQEGSLVGGRGAQSGIPGCSVQNIKIVHFPLGPPIILCL
jgi:hypothetical protein